MKRARFSEEQIIGILKAAEMSGNIREACQPGDRPRGAAEAGFESPCQPDRRKDVRILK